MNDDYDEPRTKAIVGQTNRGYEQNNDDRCVEPE